MRNSRFSEEHSVGILKQQQEHSSRVYFPHLDGLRFWAAFSIVALHNASSPESAFSRELGYAAMRAMPGALGVNFFFVLSGFLITYLLLTEQQREGRIDVRAFYLRRALRIWPLYFAVVGIGFLVAPRLAHAGAGPLPPPGYFFTFTSNFAALRSMDLPVARAYDFGPLAVLWSVCVEEQFYLLWPLLLSSLLGAGLLSRPFKKPGWFFAAACLLSLCLRIVWAWRGNEGALYYHTLAVIGDMALGGWAAWSVFSDARWVRWFERLPRRAILAGYVALLASVAVDMQWRGEVWAQALNRPLLACAFTFVILEQCYATNSFYKCGRSQWVSRLGTYSYGLYCLHWLAIAPVAALLRAVGMDKSLWQLFCLQLPLVLGLGILMAAVSYHFYEAPFLRLKRRFAHVQTT